VADKTIHWPADKVERRPISELILYARNSRTHSDAQVAQIAASIREWGWTMPILVDEDGNVIAGHGRIMAAQKLGIADVPCMTATGWSEAKRRAYVIADNKLALNAGWDDEMLRVEFGELRDLDFDLSLTGFDSDEIAAFQFDDDAEADMPNLADGDREPFQQMTFTLHDEQAEQVRAAMEKAKAMGAFVGTGNENGNGNALARICEVFNGIS
jgi:ParB-like chromosome segregation protein Spo0J